MEIGDETKLEGLDRAPEFYVEGIHGALAGATIAKFNFFSLRMDPALDKVRKMAVLSLVVPLADLSNMIVFMQKLVEDHGVATASQVDAKDDKK
jgi:hypothetical protein